MTESFELRVVEDFASRLFQPGEGKKLGSGIVRLVRLQGNDPRLPKVGSLQKACAKSRTDPFFMVGK